jgi:hypothetical protein
MGTEADKGTEKTIHAASVRAERRVTILEEVVKNQDASLEE